MKITIREHARCFAIDYEAETVADAALIARMNANGTKEVRSIYAFANESGTFTGSLVIGKMKQEYSSLPRRRE